MRIARIVISALVISQCFILPSFGRSILEKKAGYLTETGKTGDLRFWVVYLGNHELNLTRKYPGEGELKIKASMNLQLMSSGYIEGNGYGKKGKIDCLPTMHIKTETGLTQIDMDSIDCIFDYGNKVSLTNGQTGELVIDAEGTKVTPNRFLLREFKLENYFGEEILKEGSEEIPIQAICIGKDGGKKAAKYLPAK